MRNRVALLVIFVGGCSTSGSVPDGGTQAVTFHKDVEPLLQKHCLGCHSDGNIAPFSLLTYDDVKIRATQMAQQTAQKLMPPWGAQETSECTPPHPWKNDIRLNDAEINIFQAWSQAGAPEGDPKDAPPPYQPRQQSLASYDLQLKPARPYVTSGQQDQFRCFPLDVPITSLKYVNGVFFLPGNAKVVHHAVLFTDPKGQSTARADATGSYDCFGGAGVDNPAVLGVWAPGGTPIELPPTIGTPIAPGSKLVMQIHYHPGGAAAAPDTTTVQLRFATARPDYILLTSVIGNFPTALSNGDGLQPDPDDRTSAPEFRVPMGARAHTEQMVFTMPDKINGQPIPKIWLYGMMAHMHLAGVDEKITLTKASGGADSCLMQEPRWDFSWQRFYAYDVPVEELPTIEAGDKIKLRCRYDNSDGNAALFGQRTAAGVGPADLFLGEQTFDEMCLVLPQLLVKNPI